MQGLRDYVAEKGLFLVLGVFGCLRGQARSGVGVLGSAMSSPA